MDELPPEIQRRLSELGGAHATLLYDGDVQGRARATLVFARPGHVPLTVTVDGVSDATWGFVSPPALRVPQRWWQPVHTVRFATVRAFDAEASSGPSLRVRVEVHFQGAAPVAFEGVGLTIGPVDRPHPPAPVANPWDLPS